MANEIVKYNNRLNTVAFTDFTDTELRVFFAICSRVRDKGSEDVTFTFTQLKELTGERQHYTIQGYAEMLQKMYSKLIRISYIYDDGEDKAGEFNLFQGYERSLKEETITISVSPKFQFMFNQLNYEFTRFELKEFVSLRGKYPKLLYRLLKQWRTVGKYSVLLKDLRLLMDVPEEYKTKDITRRIIDPSVEKLRKLPVFANLRYEYSYKGRTVVRVIFTWTPESRINEKREDHELPDYAKYIQFVSSDGQEVSEEEKEDVLRQIVFGKKKEGR